MQIPIHPIAASDHFPQSPLKVAYQTLQWGKNIFGLAHRNAANQLHKVLFPQPSGHANQGLDPKLLNYFRQRYQALLDEDWQDAQAGIYPIELLFDNPWDEFFRFYPSIWLDLPKTWQKSQTRQFQDFSPEIDTTRYPKYYLQNFHQQTDGYLSEASANLYDLQVEILFGGMADPMRRRVLPFLKTHLEPALSAGNPIKILDVACGTGRTLRQLRAMLPKASLFGVDLSPAYLRKANRMLSQDLGELPQLVQANAEELPYQNDYFDAVASVFLFHELPPQARQRVIEECYRVLEPGGIFVLCDSIQLSDSEELTPMMEGFAKSFHEPYYRDYIQDDLGQRLEQSGFGNISCQTSFMSKYVIARKPV